LLLQPPPEPRSTGAAWHFGADFRGAKTGAGEPLLWGIARDVLIIQQKTAKPETEFPGWRLLAA